MVLTKHVSLLVCLILLPSWAWAQTNLYVRPIAGEYAGGEDGSSYANAFDGFAGINWATVDAIADGGKLFVAGTHTESLTVGQSGESGYPIVIASCTIANGASDADAGTIDAEDTRDYGIDTNDQDYITIDGLTVIDAVRYCILAEGNHNIIQNVTVTGAGINGIHGGSYFVDGRTDVTLTNVTANDNMESGIHFQHWVGTFTATNVTANGNSKLPVSTDCVGADDPWDCCYSAGVGGCNTWSNGITVENWNSGTVTFTDCTANNNGTDEVNHGRGIFIRQSIEGTPSDVTITGCTTTGNAVHGMTIYNSVAEEVWVGDITITDLTANDNGCSGILLEDLYNTTSDILIQDSTFDNNCSNCCPHDVTGCSRGAGIWAEDVTNLVIERCLFTDIQGEKVETGLLLGRGIIFGGDSAAYAPDSMTARYNIISDCDTGIDIYAYPNSVLTAYLYNNTIYTSTEESIRLQEYGSPIGTPNVTVKNNISMNPGTFHLNYDNATGDIDSDYNLFYSVGGYEDAWAYDDDEDIDDLADWRTTSGEDANSPAVADPLFVTAGSDFHIQITSPAIDVGVDVGLTTDYDEIPVPQGAGVDIGAYEYILATMKGCTIAGGSVQ